jgi:hypothetical protein
VLTVDWVPARTIGPDRTLLDGVIIVHDGGSFRPRGHRRLCDAPRPISRLLTPYAGS